MPPTCRCLRLVSCRLRPLNCAKPSSAAPGSSPGGPSCSCPCWSCGGKGCLCGPAGWRLLKGRGGGPSLETGGGGGFASRSEGPGCSVRVANALDWPAAHPAPHAVRCAAIQQLHFMQEVLRLRQMLHLARLQGWRAPQRSQCSVAAAQAAVSGCAASVAVPPSPTSTRGPPLHCRVGSPAAACTPQHDRGRWMAIMGGQRCG